MAERSVGSPVESYGLRPRRSHALLELTGTSHPSPQTVLAIAAAVDPQHGITPERQETVLSLPVMSDPDTVLAPGKRFCGYLIHSRLGGGGMGESYVASHPILRTPFAIKIFNVEPTPDPFAEAHLAARVRSAHVVGVVDAGVENGVPYVIQSYVDGVDAAELLARRRAAGCSLPFDAVCRIATHTARGLHALHQAGVVHCDVKPDNTFLRGNGQAVLGDLGLAVDPSRHAPSFDLSGTPLYLAPERWTGHPPSRKADLYALGASIHMLAVGTAPFPGEDVYTLRDSHLKTPYFPPATHDPRQAYLFAVVARLLEKDPERRYASAEEVARLLEIVAQPPESYHLHSAEEAVVGSLRVRLLSGNLATHEADALVNAANWRLTMDLGVAAALAAQAGPELVQEALLQAPAGMGDVVWTGAGRLRARWVAHAVSAMTGAVCIQRCVLRALLEADVRGVTRIAFPALGTGVGEVPMDLGACLLLEAIATFATLEPKSVRTVDIVLADDAALARWSEVLRML